MRGNFSLISGDQVRHCEQMRAVQQWLTGKGFHGTLFNHIEHAKWKLIEKDY